MKPVWPEASQFGYFSYKRPVDDFNMGQPWNNSWHARRAGLELRAWLLQVQRSSHSGMPYRDWVRIHPQVTKISGLWSFCPASIRPTLFCPDVSGFAGWQQHLGLIRDVFQLSLNSIAAIAENGPAISIITFEIVKYALRSFRPGYLAPWLTFNVAWRRIYITHIYLNNSKIGDSVTGAKRLEQKEKEKGQ